MSYRIHSMHLCEGDWFQIEIHHDSGEEVVSIERVIYWVFVEADGHVEHLDAICNKSPRIALGNNHIASSDCFYVNGKDKCPSGATWQELFDKTLPSRLNVRDITQWYKQLAKP